MVACDGAAGTAQTIAAKRAHPFQEQIRQLANSIACFGVIAPIIADDRGRIVAGHARAEAAKLLGLNRVPVIRLSHLNDKQLRAYMLADNKLAEKAGWNRELLSIELEELQFTLQRLASILVLRDLSLVKSTN